MSYFFLAQVIEQLSDGTFSKTGNPDEFKDILDNLLYHDRYLTFADYDAYIMAQDKVNATYMVSCFPTFLHFLIASPPALQFYNPILFPSSFNVLGGMIF